LGLDHFNSIVKNRTDQTAGSGHEAMIDRDAFSTLEIHLIYKMSERVQTRTGEIVGTWFHFYPTKLAP